MKLKLLFDSSPELLLEWNFDRNYLIDPWKLTYGSDKRVWWKCLSHGHEWNTKVFRRVAGSGCPFCTNKLLLEGYNDLATTHPMLSREWDFSKNNIKPSEIGKSSIQKCWWKCDIHGHSWLASVKNRTDGYGCPVCGGNMVLNGFNDALTTHPHLREEWVAVRNGISLESISAGSHYRGWWQCKLCNHFWKTSLNARSSGKGCPNCSKGKTERAFVSELNNASGLHFESSYVNARRKLFKSSRIQIDGLCQFRMIAFEYDGEWTHGENNPQGKSYSERLLEDADTTESLLNLGYIVIRVREKPLSHVKINVDNLDDGIKSEFRLFQYEYSRGDSIVDLVSLIVADHPNIFTLVNSCSYPNF